ncbi:MAPEG family protein [Undibacterium sp. Ji50W]|uniref:MAPEG family protein n=1 Tax=Undibacterium sp. Ji50W TaxID=3413041 RepID=UPI003BF06D7E
MSIANWCVLAACVLPVISVGLAKGGSARKNGQNQVYDNQAPREWAKGLSGWQQRAHAAQQNGFEALPLFIAAVVLAQQSHADQVRIDQLALLFVAIRIVYIITYLANQAALRSLVWFAGVVTSVAILAMA